MSYRSCGNRRRSQIASTGGWLVGVLSWSPANGYLKDRPLHVAKPVGVK